VSSRTKAAAALALIIPAPTAGVLVGLTLGDTAVGPVGWALAKAWLFGLPVLWHVLIDRQRLSLSPARRGGFGMAAATGVLAVLGIIGGYLLVGRMFIEAALLRKTLEPLGLTDVRLYIAASAYWILINSVLEEYVFRWFIVRKCEAITGPALAVIASAAIFVVHHSIAMAAYFPWWINLIASAAIFAAGAVWSWLYVRYRSIWVPYLSHALADLAIFTLGGYLLFSA
jgi:uncharacterized protein